MRDWRDGGSRMRRHVGRGVLAWQDSCDRRRLVQPRKAGMNVGEQGECDGRDRLDGGVSGAGGARRRGAGAARSPGLPAFNVVGLADKAVGESRERVRGAIAAMGLALPPKRIAVNLSPADLPKEGSHFDLPIALALLGAMGVVDAETLADYVVVGELGLDARIAPSPGVLLAALHASERGQGADLPRGAGGGSGVGRDRSRCVAAPDLLALLNHFKGHGLLAAAAAGRGGGARRTAPTCAR